MENPSHQRQSTMVASDVQERIKFTYQPTSEMAADRVTKGLRASRLPQIKEDLCLIEV